MRGDEFGVIGDHHVVSQVEFIFVGDAVVGLGRLVAHARVADGGSAPAVTFADGGDGGAADLVVGGLVRVGLPLASRITEAAPCKLVAAGMVGLTPGMFTVAVKDGEAGKAPAAKAEAPAAAEAETGEPGKSGGSVGAAPLVSAQTPVESRVYPALVL